MKRSRKTKNKNMNENWIGLFYENKEKSGINSKIFWSNKDCIVSLFLWISELKNIKKINYFHSDLLWCLLLLLLLYSTE